jgi:hypothetical protein
MQKDPKITGVKQSDTIKACKHLLEMARTGRLAAIGYAVIQIDDDGDLVSGSNACWTDDRVISDALKAVLSTLNERVAEASKSGIIKVFQ